MTSRAALLVIDVQNAVVENAHERDSIVETIAGLVDRARNEGVPVVWVQHADEDLLEGSVGWEIVPELPVAEGEPIVHKRHRDSFDGTTMADVLSGFDVDRLVITGAQTDFCVRWTLHGAQMRGFDTVLVSDGHTTDDGDAAIPTAAQLIEHTNRYWTNQSSTGQTNRVCAAAEVVF